MAQQKRMLNITMLEGTAFGPLQCNLKPGHACVYKISRNDLNMYRGLDDMTRPGIYFLFGKEGHIYVGQANERMNGRGVWARVSEHNKEKEDYWTEAFMIIHKSDDLTATDLNYLENRFCNMAIEAGATVHNRKTPSVGRYSDETEVMMESLIEEVVQILGMLGYMLFETGEKAGLVQEEGIKLFLNKEGSFIGRSVDAKIVMRDGKYILLKGSKVAVNASEKCSDRIKKKRAGYSGVIDAKGNVLENIIFDSASALAQVATYSAVNGKVELKDAEGKTLKNLLGE